MAGATPHRPNALRRGEIAYRGTTLMKRFLPILAATLVVTLVAAGPVAAKKPGSGSGLTRPVTGEIVNTETGATTAITNGGLTITRFAVQNGQLVAIGTLTGTGNPDIDGQRFTWPVESITASDGSAPAGGITTQQVGSCEILDLVLGPLDLDVLGLVVHLDTVHLNITAESGPGNLLGNLLCAVAGLLDNTGGNPLTNLLNQIAGLLNQILAILGG
jgi:hypothetical protein